MTFMERSSWVVLVVAVPTLVVYAILVAPQLLDRSIGDVAWVGPMVLAFVGFVVANVLGTIAAAISNRREADRTDERDQAIDRFGERVGNWLVVAGSLTALVLAMTAADHIWIANAIFLGGIAGAIVSAVVKIGAYRGAVQPW